MQVLVVVLAVVVGWNRKVRQVLPFSRGPLQSLPEFRQSTGSSQRAAVGQDQVQVVLR